MNNLIFTKDVTVAIEPGEVAHKLASMSHEEQCEFFDEFFFELLKRCNDSHALFEAQLLWIGEHVKKETADSFGTLHYFGQDK